MMKKYEEELMIGLILIRFQKPTDAKFPRILKNMPKFKQFKLRFMKEEDKQTEQYAQPKEDLE